jgi:hypothetical protein
VAQQLQQHLQHHQQQLQVLLAVQLIMLTFQDKTTMVLVKPLLQQQV